MGPPGAGKGTQAPDFPGIRPALTPQAAQTRIITSSRSRT